MKLLFDLFPVILFFVAYEVAKRVPDSAVALIGGILGGIGADDHVMASQAPILVATLVAILATFAQVGWLIGRGRKVDRMLWVSLAIIVVMGGATILLRDPTFIMWKPTVLYWAFAVVLLFADFGFGKNLMRAMMEKQIALPDLIWRRLNLSWVGFFGLMGVLNLYVAFNFTEETWVSFKMFGGLGLMLVFVLAQGFFLSRHVEEHK